MLGMWFALTADGARLGFDAQRVIGLRLLRMSHGGAAAQAEASRMVTEKATAFAEGAITLAMGGCPRKVLRRYRAHVKANARRLSR
jgi:hypothetical protein